MNKLSFGSLGGDRVLVFVFYSSPNSASDCPFLKACIEWVSCQFQERW